MVNPKKNGNFKQMGKTLSNPKLKSDVCNPPVSQDPEPPQNPFLIAFQLPGRPYRVDEYTSYTDFIVGVRDRFAELPDYFAVRLTIKEAQSPWIKVKAALGASALYIIAFNSQTHDLNHPDWIPIPGNLIDYPAQGINRTIGINSISTAFREANTWSQHPAGNMLNHATVVILAFVISEAARFSVVYFTVHALLSAKIRRDKHWRLFRELLVNWQDLSRNNRMPQGGLIVPIPMRISNEFAKVENLNDLKTIHDDLFALGYPTALEVAI